MRIASKPFSGRTVEFVLPTEPHAAGKASWAVLHVLEEQVDQETVADALFLTSELVTDAISHRWIDGSEMRLYW